MQNGKILQCNTKVKLRMNLLLCNKFCRKRSSVRPEEREAACGAKTIAAWRWRPFAPLLRGEGNYEGSRDAFFCVKQNNDHLWMGSLPLAFILSWQEQGGATSSLRKYGSRGV